MLRFEELISSYPARSAGGITEVLFSFTIIPVFIVEPHRIGNAFSPDETLFLTKLCVWLGEATKYDEKNAKTL